MLHKNEVDVHHTNVYGVYYSFKDHIRVLVSARRDHLRTCELSVGVFFYSFLKKTFRK